MTTSSDLTNLVAREGQWGIVLLVAGALGLISPEDQDSRPRGPHRPQCPAPCRARCLPAHRGRVSRGHCRSLPRTRCCPAGPVCPWV